MQTYSLGISILGLHLGHTALPRLAAHYAGPDAHEALWDERNNLATGSQRWERIANFAQHLGVLALER